MTNVEQAKTPRGLFIYSPGFFFHSLGFRVYSLRFSIYSLFLICIGHHP